MWPPRETLLTLWCMLVRLETTKRRLAQSSPLAQSPMLSYPPVPRWPTHRPPPVPPGRAMADRLLLPRGQVLSSRTPWALHSLMPLPKRGTRPLHVRMQPFSPTGCQAIILRRHRHALLWSASLAMGVTEREARITICHSPPGNACVLKDQAVRPQATLQGTCSGPGRSRSQT